MKPERYTYILSEIQRIRAGVVLEVGTWNGDRAVAMLEACRQAIAYGSYYGFDLFEDMDAAKSAEEFNVKTPAPLAQVESKLKAFTGGFPWFKYALHKGDTNKTLPAFVATAPDHVDLAWIDGGHSVETVAADYKNVREVVRPGGVILLDDYYTDMVPGFTEKYGCNALVAGLMAEGADVSLYPVRDPVKGGGFVQIAKVVV